MQIDVHTLCADTFDALASIAQRESGLQLVPEKRLMVQSRLRPRLKALELEDFASYASHVQSDLGQSELRFMISALTTNVTHFFREQHHFDVLTQRLLPVFRKKIEDAERIRIWSAGCSKGQEAYSIAMHLLHHLPGLADADFRVLATDIDPRVVACARQGHYSFKDVQPVPAEMRRAYFTETDGHSTLSVSDKVKRHITFKELNLMHAWPMSGRFDAIFCRNVVIYFNAETQDRLWPRFAASLLPEGVLFLGHSERIADPTASGLKSIGTTSYAHETDRERRSLQNEERSNGP